jgi:hypothetical protein
MYNMRIRRIRIYQHKWQKIKKILPQAKTHAVILEDNMDEILPLGSWHWRDKSGKLVMSGIKERVMRLRGDKNKNARDDKRAAEDRSPRWVGTATELAAYCFPNKSDKSSRPRFAATNAIFI